MRLDLFLKVARLAPRRTGAKELCDGGGVAVNGQPAKAAREVRAGDRILLRQPSLLSQMGGAIHLAQIFCLCFIR